MFLSIKIWDLRKELLELSEIVYKKICEYESKELTNVENYSVLKQRYDLILRTVVNLEEIEAIDNPF